MAQSGNVSKNNNNGMAKPKEDEFIDNLSRLAVCQMSEELGFTGGIRKSTLYTLSQVMQRFIQEIGETAATMASSNGRTKVNFFDIDQVLRESMHYPIESLNYFERNSDPLPSIASDLCKDNDTNTTAAHAANAANGVKDGIDVCKNGSIILVDNETQDLMSVQEKQWHMNKSGDANKRKQNKGKKGGVDEGVDGTEGHTQKRRRNMAHIPIYCPNYPPDLICKHTNISYHASASGTGVNDNLFGNDIEMSEDKDENSKSVEAGQKRDDKDDDANDMDNGNESGVMGNSAISKEMKDDEKTRRMMIQNAQIFSQHNVKKAVANGVNGVAANAMNEVGEPNGDVSGMPPRKKMRLDSNGTSADTSAKDWMFDNPLS